MAKICFVTTVHPLHDHRFLYKECRALADAGHEVTFAVTTDEPAVMNGIDLVPLPKPASRFKRFLNACNVFGMLRRLLRIDAEVYHLVDVELLPVGLAIKWFTGRQVVYDAHEDIASFMTMKSYLPFPLGHIAKYLIVLLEWLAAARFDALVLADPGVAEDHRAMPEARKHIFYNVPPLSLFTGPATPWKDKAYDVTFLGSMSYTSGTLVLLDAIAELHRRGRAVRALFIGKPSLAHFDQHVAERNLQESIEVTGRLTYDQIPALLDSCRIGLIGLLDLPKFQKNIATKMFEYWAMGLPVISPDLPPERRYLQPGLNGLLAKPGQPSSFADAIESLLSDPDQGQRMGQQARSHLMEQGWYAEKEMEKLAAFYAWLLEHPR
jgi:glycosyltransferase involved in cell wall biosynthesis